MLASKLRRRFLALSRGAFTDLQTAPSGGLDRPLAAGKRSRPGWEWFAILLVVLLVAGVRYRLRDFPLERDEGEYAYAGQLLLEGVPPYQLAYNMKLPGTYAAYALILAAFGETPAGIHLGLTLVNGASILLVFLIARKLFDPTAAVVAGATFGLFSIRPLLMGLAGHATHFVAAAALGSLWLLLEASGPRRHALSFASGILSGLAFLMKQPGLFFAVFAGLYLVADQWRARGSRPDWTKVAAFWAGAALPYLATCLILLRAHVFREFWFWTVSYARAYGSELGASAGLHQFANRMELQKENMGLLWVLVVAGMSAFLWDRRARAHAGLVLGLLGASALALSAGLYFRSHYFLVIYPAWSLLAGVGVSSLSRLVRRLPHGGLAAALPPAAFLLAVAQPVYADRVTYFTESPHAACRRVYTSSPFPEAVEIGRHLAAETGKEARIAVFGSEPEIFFYAHRRSATGYIYVYPLVEPQPYAGAMQEQFTREVESAKPEFIVSVLIKESWLVRTGANPQIFSWMEAYLKEHYTLAGVADGGGNREVYRWGSESADYRPRRPDVVLVFRRNR
jgi:Dolichyl-phosphate-mannose-protein mannosyltransferase